MTPRTKSNVARPLGRALRIILGHGIVVVLVKPVRAPFPNVRYISSDQYHGRVVNAWKRLTVTGEACLTCNFVLDETITLLARRAGYPFAAERARAIYDSRILKILRPDEEEYYYNIRFTPGDKRLTPILTAPIPPSGSAGGKPEVVAWAVERANGGRGFGFTGGHFHDN